MHFVFRSRELIALESEQIYSRISSEVKYVSRYGQLEGQTDFCMDDGQLGTKAGWVAEAQNG
jgi:hypothetical protein